MQIRRAPHRIARYAKKIRYSGITSSPYVSPDTFKRLADLDLDAKFEHKIEDIRRANVIFINSGDVDKFFYAYGRHVQAKVLIFGNNDVDFDDFSQHVPNSVKRIYLQNSMIRDPYFGVLPIGIESLKYLTNGLPKLFGDGYRNKVKNGKILVGPFGNTHPEREKLLALHRPEVENLDFVISRLSPTEYAVKASGYSFIACPRGNGLDTHRFWETLYRGSIPLVLKSNWSARIQELGIPLIELSTWEEALNLDVISSAGRLKFNPAELAALWEPFWEEQISFYT